jgi:hypothetical protein
MDDAGIFGGVRDEADSVDEIAMALLATLAEEESQMVRRIERAGDAGKAWGVSHSSGWLRLEQLMAKALDQMVALPARGGFAVGLEVHALPHAVPLGRWKVPWNHQLPWLFQRWWSGLAVF